MKHQLNTPVIGYTVSAFILMLLLYHTCLGYETFTKICPIRPTPNEQHLFGVLMPLGFLLVFPPPPPLCVDFTNMVTVHNLTP